MWYYQNDGAPVGPITEARLRYAAKYGQVKADTLIWQQDFDMWQEASKVPLTAKILGCPIDDIAGDTTTTCCPVEVPTPAAPESAELQAPPPEASSDGDAGVVDALQDAVADDEAVEPVVDIAMAQAILDYASGRAAARSIAPTSLSTRPPSLYNIALGRGTLARVTTLAASVLLIAAATTLINHRTQTTSTRASASAKPGPVRENSQPPPAAQPPPGADTTVPAPRLSDPPAAPSLPTTGEASAIVVEGPLDAILFVHYLEHSQLVFDEQCWSQYRVPGNRLDKHPTIKLEIYVDQTGHVYDVTSSKAPQGYRGIGRCIGGRVRGWTFPRQDTATHATLTVRPLHD